MKNETKVCVACGVRKPFSFFGKNPRSSDGYNHRCTLCVSMGVYGNPTAKICSECGELKPRSAFYAHPKSPDGLWGKCKACMSSAAKTADLAPFDMVYDRDNHLVKHLRRYPSATGLRYTCACPKCERRVWLRHALSFLEIGYCRHCGIYIAASRVTESNLCQCEDCQWEYEENWKDVERLREKR